MKLARQYLRACAFRSPAGACGRDAGAGAFGGIAGVWFGWLWVGLGLWVLWCMLWGMWEGVGGVAGPAWCLPAVGWGGRVCCLRACAGVCCAGLLACVYARMVLGLLSVLTASTVGGCQGHSGTGSAGQLRRPGGAGAGWIVGRACCRCCLPGVAGHVGGCVRIIREGMPGALWRAFGPAVCGGSAAGCTGKSRKIYRKIPRKNAHEKIFKKISPYGGTVCTPKIFAKRGLTTTRSRDIFQAQQATRHRDA